MAHRRRVSLGKRSYRLTFGGTRKRLYASTLKAAVADAKYWTRFGQMRVCIDRMTPLGAAVRVKCVYRAGTRR